MFTEIKYLSLLSPRLQKFKQKKEFLWNFRCPVCGDSQRNKNKARGFVYQVKGKLSYKCHNCGISMRLDKFIEMMDPALYKEYRLEKFSESNLRRRIQKVDMKCVAGSPTFKSDPLSNLTPLDSLNNSHPALEYILNRRLPTDSLYYTESFQEWVNSVKPDTFQEVTQDEGRIIIPFRDKEGNTFGFQGRSLSSAGLRYITILLQEDKPKIFGLNTIDYDKPIYITEGPFDSLLLENSVAMAGADANTGPISGCDYIWVYDNEPRNKQITTRISKHISDGEKVVIWPANISEKDINDMVLAGIKVNDVIKMNTYKGLTANLKFNEWRK
jgi:transcription elongation factor Elf1